MSTKLVQNWQPTPKRSSAWLVTILLLGICFRFVNLDKKVYWHDEVYTSLRITAHSRSELVESAFIGEEISAYELLKYQQLDPKRTLVQAIHLLGVEDSQHSPLYYVMLRFWVQWFGNSVGTIRSLSAWISLLVFPCLYWLCQKLFASSQIAWIAIALAAVSPVQVLFAQEAREYSLWTVTILLMSAAFLQAIQQKTVLSWGVYAVTVILGLYTFLLSALVMLSHGIYILMMERFRLNKTVVAYLTASLLGILAFMPWMVYIITYFYNFRISTGWTNEQLPLSNLVNSWIINCSRIFLDFDFDLSRHWEYYWIITIVLIEVYAIYFTCQHSSPKIYLFIASLIGVTGLTLVLPDLILGGQRSISSRYLIPCFLGINLSVSYLIGMHLNITRSYQHVWGWLCFGLIGSGIFSCISIAQTDTWWNKAVSYHNPEIARIVNQTDHPFLISDAYATNPGNLVSLSYLFDSKVKLLLIPEVGRNPVFPNIDFSDKDIFILNLPQAFRNKFETKYKVDLVAINQNLWKVK